MTIEHPFHTAAPTPMFQPSSGETLDPALSALPPNIPKEAVDIIHVDSMIAREMSNMSVHEREQAYLDVHGISPVIDETPELLSTKLMEMEKHIQSQRQKEAYDIAESMNPQYVQNPEFRLMFLRSDLFDAQSAALRFIRHFEAKRDLFGVEKLTIEITQDDLDKEAMDALYIGYAQYLHTPDKNNRIVAIWFSCADHESYNVTSLLRREFYANMLLLRTNKAVQHLGIVNLLYLLKREPGTPFPYDQAWAVPKLASALPIRVAGFHMCHNNKWLAPLLAFIKSSFNLVTRVRIRTHYGTHDEVMASLQGHGVLPDLLPISAEGTITNAEAYRDYLREMRRQERMMFPRRPTIAVPCSLDVLFGKGSSVQTFDGNIRMRQMVAERHQAYEGAEKGKKAAVAQEVVDMVLQTSGMFLKQADDGGDYWLTVDNDTARTKVGAAFRTLRLRGK